MSRPKTIEPLLWALFSGGGMVTALFMPITIVITGIAVPAGWISEQGLYDLIHHPLTRLYLFVLISLPLFHWAHRFQAILHDMGMRNGHKPMAAMCYGGAFLGTLIGAYLLITL